MNLPRTALVLVVVPAIWWGCERSPDSAGASANAPRAASSAPAGGVDPALIDSCAGFSVESAAELLGVAASALSDESGRSEALGGQTCRYWSHESLIGPGLQFLLEVEPAPAAAAARLRTLREEAPAGDAAIGAAVGQARNGRSVIAFEGIGDEAFWDPLTGGVNLRVGNVLASIQASAQRRVLSDSDPVQVELERRVAERIARGLTTR